VPGTRCDQPLSQWNHSPDLVICFLCFPTSPAEATSLFSQEAQCKEAKIGLRLYYEYRRSWILAEEPSEGWVWPAETKDGHINHDSLKLQHKKALKVARIRPFEIYSIRHTFLTRLGESGCDVWTLARIAGHSNISISQRYVHPSEDAVLNALSRLRGHNSRHSAEIVMPVPPRELPLSTASDEI
jgi:hypothetical protein